jgi:hypothetical protein
MLRQNRNLTAMLDGKVQVRRSHPHWLTATDVTGGTDVIRCWLTVTHVAGGD